MISRPLHPDFAVEAYELLSSSRALDAIRLCSNGIEAFPNYAGGYVILAKAYAALGRSDDAEALSRDIALRFPHIRVDLPTPITEPVDTTVPSAEIDDSRNDTGVVDDVPHHDVVAFPVDVSANDSAVGVSLDTPAEVASDSQPARVEEDQPEGIVELIHAEFAEQVVPSDDEQISEQGSSATSSAPTHVLRMIETAPVADDARIIRSSSVRLIPGLEFTTLRVEGLRSRGRRGIGSLPEPPPFRNFHPIRRPARPAEPTPPRKPVSLEELAMRLIDAKMPRQSEMDAAAAVARSEPPAVSQAQPILVTDTIATIYMQQQSYDLAIEAFRTLMARKPERREHYEALIRECERKRG